MLKRLVAHPLVRLLAAVVVLHISAGMLYLHPSFHQHPEHDCHSRPPCHAAHPEELAADETHACPLCELLAINQFFLNLSEPASERNRPYDHVTSIDRLQIIKAHARHVEPRASPFLSTS